MNWFLLILASVFTISFSNILQKVALKDDKSDVLAYSFVFQFLSGLTVLVITLFTGFQMPPVADYPVHFIVMGLLYAGATYFFFKALQLIDLSQLVIFHSTRAFWTMIAAAVFLGERINLIQILGAVIVFSAIFLVSFKKGRFKLNKGSWYALIAGICIGLALVLDSYLLKFSEQFSYTVVAFFIPAFFLLLINARNLAQIRKVSTSPVIFKILGPALLFGISVLLIYGSLSSGGNASQVMPIGLSSTVLIVILSAVFLREREELWKKLFAGILVIIGVFLLR